jgi:hypothetical protein
VGAVEGDWATLVNPLCFRGVDASALPRDVTGGAKGNARMTQPRRFRRSGARVSERLDQLASINDAKGQSMSIKLTDTQFAVLSDAGRREDRCLVASPSLKGGARLKLRIS